MTPEKTSWRSLLWRATKIAIAIALLGYLAHLAIGAVAGLRARRWHPRWGFLLLSLPGLIGGSFVFPRAMQRGLGAIGGELSYRDGFTIVWLSNLGRYLPGQVWSLMWMAAQLRAERDITLGGATTATMMFHLAGITSCGAIMIGALPWWHGMTPLLRYGVPALLAAALLIGLHWRGPIRLADLLARRLLKIELPSHLLATFRRQVVIGIGGWALIGISYTAMLAGLAPLHMDDTLVLVGLMAGSLVISLLVLITPAGLGVTESLQTASAAQLLGDRRLAALIALSTRLWLVARDLALGAMALIAQRLDLSRRQADANEADETGRTPSG